MITAAKLLAICEGAGSLVQFHDQLADSEAAPYSGGPKDWSYDDEAHMVHIKPDGTRIDKKTGLILPTEAERLAMERERADATLPSTQEVDSAVTEALDVPQEIITRVRNLLGKHKNDQAAVEAIQRGGIRASYENIGRICGQNGRRGVARLLEQGN